MSAPTCTDCATATAALVAQLQAELDAASTCETTVTLTAATATAVATLDTDCAAATCSAYATTATSAGVYTVYNFDLPVHAMVDALLFGKQMAAAVASTCDTSRRCVTRSDVWSDVTLTQVDKLGTKADLYQWHAWFTLLSQYAEAALRVNGYNAQTAARALSQVALDEDYQRDRLDTRIDAQRREDVLDAATECPRACQAAADAAYERQAAHDRDGAASGRIGRSHRKRGRECGDEDDDDGFTSYGRQRRKRARIFVPIDRKPKSGFDHLLDDVAFERDCQRLEADVAEVASRKRGVQRAQLLAKNVRDVLQHASGAFARMLALVDAFLREWEAADFAAAGCAGSVTSCTLPTTGTGCDLTLYTCPTVTVTGPPLSRRLAFQQQLKAQLLDLRTFMSRQYVDGTVALCENRCDGYGAYYPHFNYVVSDCVRGATVASGDAFWTDAQTHVTQRGVCVARAVVSKTSAWAEGTVVTKETVRAYIQALERAGAVMGLCG